MIIAQTVNFAESVDEAFLFILIVSVFFLVLITGLIIYFIIKYSRKRNKKPKNIHGNIPLEILWTVVPTILVLIMFWYGWVGYKQMSSPPDDALEVDVTAQMWLWKFKYKNGVQSDSLYVPLNQPVKTYLTSLDVNHSFYIPEFRLKKDVLPGRNNFAWFLPDKLGSFTILCAEYCGLNHSYMLNKVIVLPQDEFDIWMNKKVREMEQQSETAEQADTTATDPTDMEPLINK
jgi:cytochrome c oxidase subunit II